jgi:hypothetical protein
VLRCCCRAPDTGRATMCPTYTCRQGRERSSARSCRPIFKSVGRCWRTSATTAFDHLSAVARSPQDRIGGISGGAPPPARRLFRRPEPLAPTRVPCPRVCAAPAITSDDCLSERAVPIAKAFALDHGNECPLAGTQFQCSIPQWGAALRRQQAQCAEIAVSTIPT